MDYYCAKDNRQTDASKGCLHPRDFCSHRNACFIHFMEKEKERAKRREREKKCNSENSAESQE